MPDRITDDEITAVVQAHKDGKQIQCIDRRDNADKWENLSSPAWNFQSYSYRVNPEPREWNVRICDDGLCFSGDCITEKGCCSNSTEIFKVREVLE